MITHGDLKVKSFAWSHMEAAHSGDQQDQGSKIAKWSFSFLCLQSFQ